MSKFHQIEQFSKNRETLALLAIFFVLLFFFIPLITGMEGICHDDAAFASFPRLMAVSRCIKNGEIPLWDSHEYSGAKPFYSMMEAPIYNIVFYPFYFMANLKNIDQSFFVLYILPFILLIMFSAYGMYFLFRKVIKANYLISALIGIVYALNPSMGISNLSLIDTCVFSYIPWIILCIARFLETKKFKWWLLGILFLFLLNTAYTLNYTFRIYFIIGVITLILFIWHFIKDKKSIIFILYTASMFIIAIGITAFVWAGILEGITWETSKVGNRLKLMLKEVTYSLPPGHLITMFIPGFNGTLDNYHTWGDGFLVHSADRILSGGIITTFLVLCSFLLLINNKKYNLKIDDNLKIWLFIGLFVDLLALSIMLGKYSPIYYFLCAIAPWFFAIPFPFYYHFAQHLGTIIAAGAVLTVLFKNIDYIENLHIFINLKLLLFYLGFVILFIIIYLNLPVYYPPLFQKYGFSNFNVLVFYRDLNWFITNPIIYFIIISASLLIVVRNMTKHINLFLGLFFIGVFIEALLIGYPLFYRNQIMPRANQLNSWQAFRRRHYTYPSTFLFFKQIKELDELLDKNTCRYTSGISITENLAWVTDTRSFSGYDAKPVFREMSRIILTFYKNWPYEMWPYVIPRYLLSNMNVGYFIQYDNSLSEENKLYDYKDAEGRLFYATRPPELLEKIADERYEKYFKLSYFKIHKLDKPMPYIYFQNKLYSAVKEDQLKKLLFADLRSGAYISNSFSNILPLQKEPTDDIKITNNISNEKQKIIDDEIIEKQKKMQAEFEKLQSEKNQIININMRKTNQLSLTVKVEEPCMLIRSEAFHPGWKVIINDKEGKIVPLNYLMQGIYLEKGQYNITFKFFPKSLAFGLIISLCFLVIIIIIILINLLIYLSKKKK